MLLAGRFKCPSPANPGNKTPFGASVFMHQLLCAWAFVRVLKGKPCALQGSPGVTSYWAFRPSPMGPMQNCCRGLRARTETSTYPGWCVCVPTPAPILRPQDHCESAQVWVGAPNWQLLLHQKGTHTQPTQSKRTLGTPRGRHGRYARQGSWVGEPGGGLAHMAVCGGCTDTGENPRLTLAAGACVP